MALPLSGDLSFNQIGVEIQRPSGAILDIKDAELGVYVPLNVYSTYKPNGVVPCSVSEWYGYNHTQAQFTPFFQVVKNSVASTTVNTNFNMWITVANIGNAPTTGALVTFTDTLPANMQIVTWSAPGWNVNVTNQTLVATRNDSIPANSAYNDIIIVGKIINCATGAYYNQANVTGGGTSGIFYSNTITINATLFSSTKTVSRSIQKNDCAPGCVGTYTNVTSPQFTRTSCISQADADNLATQDCNNWLDANGQGIANTNGSCVCNPPVYSVNKGRVGSGAILPGQQFNWQIAVTVGNNNTNGSTVSIADTIDSNFTVISCQIVNPSGWTTFISGQTANAFTNNTLVAGQTYYFVITVQANASGTFNNTATVSGGGGTTASGSASVSIAAPQPISLSIVDASVARPETSFNFLGTNYYGIYEHDSNDLNHDITIRVANGSAAPGSIVIQCDFNDTVFLYLFAGGIVPNSTDWAFDQIDSVFYNKTTINPGDYSFTYIAAIRPFTGTIGSYFTFFLKYNGSMLDSRNLGRNIVSRVRIDAFVRAFSNTPTISNLLFESVFVETGRSDISVSQPFTMTAVGSGTVGATLNSGLIYVKSVGTFNYNIFNGSKSIRYKLNSTDSCPINSYSTSSYYGNFFLTEIMTDNFNNLLTC
jgi:uncharacterized repeat protein (TIGR01451 family)